MLNSIFPQKVEGLKVDHYVGQELVLVMKMFSWIDAKREQSNCFAQLVGSINIAGPIGSWFSHQCFATATATSTSTLKSDLGSILDSYQVRIIFD